VDDIRALVDQIRVPPSIGKYKVYIIDEVHMLSAAAFNAFLKTLEEPPPYVKFILATTEKHKIIPTILSRCQSFDFRRIPVPEISAHLRTISTAESIEAENEALVIISQKGDGSLRDSLSIFDRIASQSKGKITYDGVLDSLQLLDYDYFFRMTDALMREDTTEVFLTLADIQQRGFDGEAFITGFSEHLRDVLLCKDTATAELLTHGDKIKSRYLNQAEAIQKSSLITYLDLINQCEITYNRSLNKWLHIEMALVRMCYMHRKVEMEPGSISGMQKKKPDVKSSSGGSNSSNGKSKASATEEELSIPTPSIPEKSPQSNPTPKSNAPLESIEVPNLLKVDMSESGIPSLKGLGALRQKAEVLHEEEKKKVPVLTLPPVIDFWKEFAAGHSSPSVTITMSEAIIEVKDENTILIRTGNQTGKNRLIAETNLLEGLRSLVRIPDLQIVIDIDPDLDKSQELVKPKKLLSNREKFEILATKNPLIHKLRDNLDLVPDQED
jgi:DNA polymerase-3 subunit gamma/tau